jgi:hypothetical protein
VLVDTTALGSAKDGLYITDDEIYIKPSYEPRAVIKIRDIKTIRIYEGDCEISINGRRYKYLHSSLTARMEIIVKCIRKYLDQFDEATQCGDRLNSDTTLGFFGARFLW